MMKDVINNQIKIPVEWHTSIHKIGQKFDSVAEVRLALQYYSIVKRFKNFSIMSIKNFYSTHTCGQHGANAGHSRASRKFIASQIQYILKVKPDLRPIDIKNDLFSHYSIKINYCKAWQRKERAQQELFSDDDEAYDSLRWYEAMVQATNPGSRVATDANDGRFRRLFIGYNVCIKGFIAGCRPLLFLDGTFLKDRYRGKLLSITRCDGNQRIFPLAYCVCDQENEANWKWFLQ
ncbi:uncharacterized protein LOC109847225 [Asparagus officinalis]|uniref:uncharacterized protein LOC109847225 n=1 Tax=Asparagus officinalis TaxID=4686 RepID=UPI00098DFE78|nr:uncharacterized protein LOC109847225 [Asparagus officinalis]